MAKNIHISHYEWKLQYSQQELERIFLLSSRHAARGHYSRRFNPEPIKGHMPKNGAPKKPAVHSGPDGKPQDKTPLAHRVIQHAVWVDHSKYYPIAERGKKEQGKLARKSGAVS